MFFSEEAAVHGSLDILNRTLTESFPPSPCTVSVRSRDVFDEFAAVNDFRKDLASEMTKKFKLDKLQASSRWVMSAAMDPRFRSLGFCASIGVQVDSVHHAVLSAAVSCQPVESTSDSEVSEPPAKRSCQPSGLDLLFGVAAEEEVCVSAAVEQEVNMYFAGRPAANSTVPLAWWKVHEEQFPHLAVLAQKYLSIVSTSVPSERVFSACGLLVDKLCCSLSPETVDAMVFLAKNSILKSGRSHSGADHDGIPTLLRQGQDVDAEQLEQPPLPVLTVADE
eukprot:scpid88077/ scgid2524/ 